MEAFFRSRIGFQSGIGVWCLVVWSISGMSGRHLASHSSHCSAASQTHSDRFSYTTINSSLLHQSGGVENVLCTNSPQCTVYSTKLNVKFAQNSLQCIVQVVQFALKGSNGTFVCSSWTTVQCFSWLAPLFPFSLFIPIRLLLKLLVKLLVKLYTFLEP